jgi:hypothetical protein
VPGIARRDDPEFVQLQLVDGGPRQRHVRAMRWVKGTAKNADAPRSGRGNRLAQSQSLRSRKSRVKAASGDSGGSSRR